MTIEYLNELSILFDLKPGSRGFLSDLFGGAKNLFGRVDDFGSDAIKVALREINRGARRGIDEINKVVETMIGNCFWKY